MKNKLIYSRVAQTIFCLLVLTGVSGTVWYCFQRRTTPAIDMNQLAGLDGVIPVAIIGSGPAGLSAAVYTARANFHTVIFEGKKPGGQLMDTSDVENWPGVAQERGSTIISGLRDQALKFHAIKSPATIERVDLSRWPFVLTTDNGTELRALTIIMATGADHKMLDVPGEKTYWGHGVTACATCDAPFYKDKTAIVVGGGDTAAEDALQLASHAQKIIVAVRGEKMRASYASQQRLKAYPHIQIRYQTKVTEIIGDGNKVTAVQLQTAEGQEQLPVDGVFLAVGHAPNSGLVAGQAKLDDRGFIATAGATQATSVPGLFAAGDVSDPEYHQAGVAAGDGIKAGLDAIRFLTESGFSDQRATEIKPHLYFPPQQTTANFELLPIESEEQFATEVLAAPTPVVVDYYTPTCPTCLQMLPILQTVAAEYQGKIKVVKVNGAKLPQLMSRFNVSSVPCCLVFQQGIVVGRSTALMNQREMHTFFKKYLSSSPNSKS